jgi:hypothetical protein
MLFHVQCALLSVFADLTGLAEAKAVDLQSAPCNILAYYIRAIMARSPVQSIMCISSLCELTVAKLWHIAGKLAGLDKKLSRNLDQEVQLGSSPLELSKSPVGPLAESSR